MSTSSKPAPGNGLQPRSSWGFPRSACAELRETCFRLERLKHPALAAVPDRLQAFASLIYHKKSPRNRPLRSVGMHENLSPARSGSYTCDGDGHGWVSTLEMSPQPQPCAGQEGAPRRQDSSRGRVQLRRSPSAAEGFGGRSSFFLLWRL